MKNYRVMFSQYWIYEVEAEDEWDAESKAAKKFDSDMRCSVAHVIYDECEVECLDEDDEDDDNWFDN